MKRVRKRVQGSEPASPSRWAKDEGVPSLQGYGRVAEPDLDILQRHWPPATRALVGAGVLATGVYLATHYGGRAS